MERPDRAPAVTFFSTDEFVVGTSVSLGDDAAQHALGSCDVRARNAGDEPGIHDLRDRLYLGQ